MKSTWEESIYRGFKKEKKRKAKSQGNDLKICHLSFSALEIVYNISHTKSSNSGRVKLQKALSAADYIVSISTERLLARLYRVASLRGRSYNRSIFFISLLFLFHARWKDSVYRLTWNSQHLSPFGASSECTKCTKCTKCSSLETKRWIITLSVGEEARKAWKGNGANLRYGVRLYYVWFVAIQRFCTGENRADNRGLNAVAASRVLLCVLFNRRHRTCIYNSGGM